MEFLEFWIKNCKDVLDYNIEIDFLLYLYFHLGDKEDEE